MSTSDRPVWARVWMNIAWEISRRSTDPRLKVGSIVVPDDNTAILAIGYNGDERGGTNEHESSEPGQSGFLHSEINNLIKLDFSFPRRKIMYVTHFPCRMCCKAIVNAGIAEVVYDEVYRDMSGRSILEHAGIIVSQVSEKIAHERMPTI